MCAQDTEVGKATLRKETLVTLQTDVESLTLKTNKQTDLIKNDLLGYSAG